MTFEIIKKENHSKWLEITERFSKKDVYYLNAYVSALTLHGDGEPLFAYYRDENCEIGYVVMKQDIADAPEFRGYLAKEQLFDFSTPYGYGGFLYEGQVTNSSLHSFFASLQEYCVENRIVSQFIRFHPLLQNQKFVEKFCNILKHKSTIYMDTTSPEKIMENMTSKNRNMVRKAMNSEINIDFDKGENLDAFLKIYNETMDANQANSYYYFDKTYFRYLIENLKDNFLFFHARHQGEIISSAIILFNAHSAHYHLSGTKRDFRNLAPGNLLLYKVAVWAAEHGISKFHLGGGINQGDNLFAFKKSFNKNGHLDFYIGSNIFMEDKFSYLIELREKIDNHFDCNNKFLIQYRG
ncbi:MAG: GNAT family N-acetyltransferase [Oscillospiraceae bacterium]|nr:GNAT family N-acetyltransferase [Oscillospiraceae bacterium]